jgi:hypothetical protein
MDFRVERVALFIASVGSGEFCESGLYIWMDKLFRQQNTTLLSYVNADRHQWRSPFPS